MSKKKQPEELSELGEFGLIDQIASKTKLFHPETKLGIGDDAAIIQTKEAQQLVCSTDLLIEGTHFNLMYMPLKHLGYKAIVVNLSDIYAMNALASQVTVSIAVSNRFSLQAIEELYKGIHLACERYKVDLVGGDTSSSPSGLCISVTAIGFANSEKITQRTGAKHNDLICVTGDLGAAYMGLQVLEREKEVFQQNSQIQPDLASYAYIVERQLKPEAQKQLIEFFDQQNIQPTSMIDVSDGLASELFHICKASNCGVQIYEEKIPIDQQTHSTALEMNLSPTMCALNGGEDYELLFTINQKDFETLKDQKNIHIIGHITEAEAGKNLVTPNETVVPLQAQGFKHFNT